MPEKSFRLAIAAIFKNEHPYILEWVAYHRALGVDSFFIADNNSDDGTTELLAALDAAGTVVHIPFPHIPDQPPQLAAYREIMRRHKDDADWFAFVDADEFLFPTDGAQSIRPLFQEINDDPSIGAVAVNWAIYGSSGHEHPDERLVIERFDARAPQAAGVNAHYKSIVRSSAWLDSGSNPHRFQLSTESTLVHANGTPVIDKDGSAGLSSVAVWDRLRLNHYVVKSRDEFTERKSPKGRADAIGRNRTAEFFALHDRNDAVDPMPQWALSKTEEALKQLSVELPDSARAC